MPVATGTGDLREALTPSKLQPIYPQWCLLGPLVKVKSSRRVGQTLQVNACFCSECCGPRFGFYSHRTLSEG